MDKRSRCQVHNIDFSLTCPICEVEMEYLTRPYLIQDFRDGVNHQPVGFRFGQAREAWLHGLKTGNWYRARQPKKAA